MDEDIIQYSDFVKLEKVIDGMKSAKIKEIKMDKLSKVFTTLKSKKHQKILGVFQKLSVS